MRKITTVATAIMLMVALSAGATLATGGLEFRYGTNAGDALYGTPDADAIDGLGGADLIKGYGSGDLLVGGDESGLGDKIVGGGGRDTLDGERGDDALYGGRAGDKIMGRGGNDLIEGGSGEDTLNSGSGPDTINAKDGQKDTIICGNEAETVYYDKGLDVLKGCLNTSEAQLVAEQAPADLFEHTAKVLIEHKGKELCVAEKALEKGFLKHADIEVLNPSSCSNSEQGRS